MEMGEWSWWMVEKAKEELKKLEIEYPNKFGYLKVELEKFIISAAQEDYYFSNDQFLPSSSVSTQGSSSSRNTKKFCRSDLDNVDSAQCANSKKIRKLHDDQKTSVDAAIGRAEACLRKIREEKFCRSDQDNVDSAQCANHDDQKTNVDTAIERAKACLRKIREEKFCQSDLDNVDSAQCANSKKIRKFHDDQLKTSVDAAIERAEACLRKIRETKLSLSSGPMFLE